MYCWIYYVDIWGHLNRLWSSCEIGLTCANTETLKRGNVGLPQLLHLHEWSPSFIIVDLFCGAHKAWSMMYLYISICVWLNSWKWLCGLIVSSHASEGSSTSCNRTHPSPIRTFWYLCNYFLSALSLTQTFWIISNIEKNKIQNSVWQVHEKKAFTPPLNYFSICKKHSQCVVQIDDN